jgi:type IV pilus assembly protein PilV
MIMKKYIHQGGSILLEALVSILIFAFGVLALFAMQSTALQNMSQSNYRATAVYMANQLIGSAQGDINHLDDYQYTGGTAALKVAPWLDEVTAALPNASAIVEASSVSSTMTVTVSWQAPGESVRHQQKVSTYVSY